MATAILYRSKHGTTLKAAQLIQSKLHDEIIDLYNLRHHKSLNIDGYDTIIIGGSIHSGKLQSDLKRLMAKMEGELLSKRLGLFLCCMEEQPKSQHQFNQAFPKALRNHAVCKSIMGGEFLLEEMNFAERFLIKNAAGVTESISKLKLEEIDYFAAKVNASQGTAS